MNAAIPNAPPASIRVPSIDSVADEYIQKAHQALAILSHFTQDQVDAIAYDYALVVYNKAEKWSRDTVEESKIGNVPDKILKKRNKAESIWNEIKNEKTVGVIEHDEDRHIIKIAEPLGIVAGICPCTNPVVTLMNYALLAIKTRNALIISAHPRSAKVTKAVAKEMLDVGSSYGLPPTAIQALEKKYDGIDMLALSRAVMKRANLIVATGGPSIVKIAYESGTPAYGVGAGNTPVIVHHSADLADAARKIIIGRSFDNGIICASEQHLIVSNQVAVEMRKELEANGAYFLDSKEDLRKIKKVLSGEDGHFDPDIIGKSAKHIAEKAGISVPDDVRAFVMYAWANEIGKDIFSGEKMFPLLTYYTYDRFEDAVKWSNQLLCFQGKGHTAGIHMANSCFQNEKHMMLWANETLATHLIVNQSTATSAGGNKFNWITASTTLGCGAYGGTTPMETINLSVKQMLNYKIVAMSLSEPRPSYNLI